MGMSKLAIIDIDNCLLDWSAGFSQWMQKEGHEITPADSYDLMAHYPSVTCPKELKKQVLRFNSSRAFARLELMPSTLEFITDLQQEGWELMALSCFVPPYEEISGNPISPVSSKVYRYDNLQLRCDGLFSKFVFRELGATKADIFIDSAMAYDHVLMIDDAPKYINEGIKVADKFDNFTVYIYNQPYNQEISPEIVRVGL